MTMNKNPDWKSRVQDLFDVCQEELKRTTAIGKKMLSASKTNSSLHESYEELGVLAYDLIKKGELSWDHPRAKELVTMIEKFHKDLDKLEKDVSKIKVASKEEEEESQ